MINRWKFRLRWFWHILYWGFSVVFFYYFLSFQVGRNVSDWFVIFLTPITIVTTYFFTHYLIPSYLNKKLYFKFFLYSAYTIILSVYLTMIVIFIIFIFVVNLNVQLAYFKAAFLLIGIYIPVIAGIAIRLYHILQQSEEKNLKLLQQKTEAELKFLKSQIEPHFLFNTLNNIYSLTLDKSEKAPEVVLQLSELLSYIIYDCTHATISLGRELEQLENYISLEQLRYDQRVTITRDIQPGLENLDIMPLILLPLMENCFKHGVKASARKSWIQISLKKQDGRVVIRINNSLPQNKEKGKQGGIGLENLKNRLKMFYGENHNLTITKNETSFNIEVIISLPS
jgi:LytS/YehU family sensor histidine kinase